ncbi:MAG TPA: archaetidylserine decarboxylase [Steroidobacteraceae bacterium]|nr:archaetidylserine decarboxylase [Steroidobacteraceae bacterium]
MPAHEAPRRARLFVALQHLLPQHALSRVVYHLTRSRVRVLKSLLIASFVRAFHPRMAEAAEPDPHRYPTFNHFFTRALREGARPIAPEPATVISPVDGAVSQIGQLAELTIIQAKGRHYRLDALLGALPAHGQHLPAAAEWTRRLRGGTFATLYLAPYDYHRIHMPLAGALRAAWYVPGRLFSVNAVTCGAVDSLYARNERVVCAFDGERGVSFVIVLVGALFVGSIGTLWHGEITPRGPRRRRELPSTAGASGTLGKGAEMGRFNMGSTVIVLFPERTLEWAAALTTGSIVRMGETLGRLRTS